MHGPSKNKQKTVNSNSVEEREGHIFQRKCLCHGYCYIVVQVARVMDKVAPALHVPALVRVGKMYHLERNQRGKVSHYF